MNAGKEDDESSFVSSSLNWAKMNCSTPKKMAERYLNEGFSGGEKKKRNEILQLS